jgi:hypothetical protein
VVTRVPFLTTRFGGYLHREVPEEDAELTHVGPDTPCGEYLRRFWQPICISDELKDLRSDIPGGVIIRTMGITITANPTLRRLVLLFRSSGLLPLCDAVQYRLADGSRELMSARPNRRPGTFGASRASGQRSFVVARERENPK